MTKDRRARPDYLRVVGPTFPGSRESPEEETKQEVSGKIRLLQSSERAIRSRAHANWVMAISLAIIALAVAAVATTYIVGYLHGQ